MTQLNSSFTFCQPISNHGIIILVEKKSSSSSIIDASNQAATAHRIEMSQTYIPHSTELELSRNAAPSIYHLTKVFADGRSALFRQPIVEETTGCVIYWNGTSNY